MMSEQLTWTQKLGDAFLAQQADVMDAIQRLRLKAQTNAKLSSTPQQRVTAKQEGGRQIISIEPAQPNEVYVPYYDPAVLYGTWDYPSYPPYYWPTYWPGYVAGGIIAVGIGFGLAYALGNWGAAGACCWGGGVSWGNRNINISGIGNINRPWQHNPAHRRGVGYTNAGVAQRFAAPTAACKTGPTTGGAGEIRF